MVHTTDFEVIIIGGSYAGLAAAMSLGRALRQVLVIDSGKPCNRQAPHSHNFITQDGQTPKQILVSAKDQVAKYDTIKFYDGLAASGAKTESGFEIKTATGDTFSAKKLIFTTGLKDIMPALEGFSECWGISIIHCPYCHGYEVRHEKTGILGNGDAGFHYGQLISNWTKQLVLFTNGKSTLTAEQTAKLKQHHIQIIETEVDRIAQESGQVSAVILKDKASVPVRTIYNRPDFVQHSPIPVSLGCEITEQGLIKVDAF